MSEVDWSRATITMKVPVVHTTMETWEEIEIPWAYLVGNEGLRKAQQMRLGDQIRQQRGEGINTEVLIAMCTTCRHRVSAHLSDGSCQFKCGCEQA